MFALLNFDGFNFLEWVNNAKTVLRAKDIARTLTVSQTTISANPTIEMSTICKWQALFLLCCHLDQSLRL
jgi:hypothetical protein